MNLTLAPFSVFALPHRKFSSMVAAVNVIRVHNLIRGQNLHNQD